MTNDDKKLIKDIAVICGKTLTEVTCSDGFWFCDEKCEEFNPLADTIEAKAFCWDLMIKHDIRVCDFFDRDGDKPTYYAYKDRVRVTDKNPQRAVLRAVRELNNPTV